jgi:glycosyltransferase involved in cell wall biosynthesis
VTTERSRPLLSAALIVRNEADFLRRCLSSIAPVCDEIVVVDTGSTDDSREVARSFGAVTADRPWDDDFSAARNHALGLVTGEWVLYIDADEELDAVDPVLARRELENATDAVSLLVRFRTRPMFTPYREFRLWRHRPDVRFVGRIHESMVADILRVAEGDSLVVRDSEHFAICHYGYEGSQEHKWKRDLPLLERRVVEFPERCYLWDHLGNLRYVMGDIDGAIEAWNTGIALVRRRGVGDRVDILCYGDLGMCLLERGDDIGALVDEMLAIAPWYHVGHWLAAANHRALGRHEKAVAHLRRLRDHAADPADRAVAYNSELFTTWTWEALGGSLFALGRLDEALELYDEALASQPDNLEFRTKATALRAMVRRA